MRLRSSSEVTQQQSYEQKAVAPDKLSAVRWAAASRHVKFHCSKASFVSCGKADTGCKFTNSVLGECNVPVVMDLKVESMESVVSGTAK